MSSNPVLPDGDVRPNLSNTEAPLPRDFLESYYHILSIEDSLHSTTDLQQIRSLSHDLLKYAERVFPLSEGLNQECRDFLSEQGKTAYHVYRTKTKVDVLGGDLVIHDVETEFDRFLEMGDTGGMVRSIKRLDWLSESAKPVNAQFAKIAKTNKQQMLDDYSAEK